MPDWGASKLSSYLAGAAARGVYGIRSGPAKGSHGAASGSGCAVVIAKLAALAVALVVAIFSIVHISTKATPPTDRPGQPGDSNVSSANRDKPQQNINPGFDRRTGPYVTPGFDVNPPANPDYRDFDQARLQRDRLKVLGGGNIDEYNKLLEQHRARYRQHGIDPCTSGFFPQGCSTYYASDTSGSKDTEKKDDVEKHNDGASSGGTAGDGDEVPPSKKSQQSKPSGIPTGTVSIDQAKGRYGWDKDQLHGIKDAIRAGPDDWVGVDKNGNVWTGEAGRGRNYGNWRNLIY